MEKERYSEKRRESKYWEKEKSKQAINNKNKNT